MMNNYSVSLNEEVVERAKKISLLQFGSGKLSPLLNQLLKKWVEENK